MTIPVHIKGGAKNVTVLVSDLGQLVVAPIAYDEVSFNEMNVAIAAFNFYEPEPGMQFVITSIYMKADRGVSNTVDATIILYESDAIDSLSVDKVLFQVNLVRGNAVNLAPLNILVSEGVWINGRTSDTDIFSTVTGYYIDVSAK